MEYKNKTDKKWEKQVKELVYTNDGMLTST